MKNNVLVFSGKTLSHLFRSFNLGNGSTWPGHIALKANKNFIKDILSNSKTKTIIVAGTNGKTTTASLIRKGLEENNRTVFQNRSGANLLNGIASSILLNTNAQGNLTQDFAIFEVDENSLPAVLRQVTPDYLILLNLFRDQLDRYGEINTIAQKWQKAISTLSPKTQLILNADDPLIAYLGFSNKNTQEKQKLYFGLDMDKTEKNSHQAADSVSCPKCGSILTFETNTFSHLGKWKCKKCGLERPKNVYTQSPFYPLSGIYNIYNSNAAALVLRQIGLTDKEIQNAFKNFKPAFGRQEIIHYQERNVQLFLSKNPTSFNQSYQTIKELHGSTLLIVLNDRIPDGRDISWIWDTDLSGLERYKQIVVAGDRVYDMALRLKYELEPKVFETKVQTFEVLKEAIDTAVNLTEKNGTVYLLPTYSAMLDSRKILTGKKIL
jgi:lipid II isoglutaminyl synthase (glutamine-hydrolysing)